MPKNNVNKVPIPTLERLATYLTALIELNCRKIDTVSSSDIEQATGINAAQFRKDLSYFGEFGRPGIGYDVEELKARLARILKVEQAQRVLLVGAGNLGSALIGFPVLKAQNFHIVAVFDNNYNKIGRKLWDLEIRDIAELAEVNTELQAQIGIIAVPATAAQQVACKLVEAGVKAILNFAPAILRLPEDVVVRNVDFGQELAVLAFHLTES
jgi:redox-sensing transcriptional repressor